LQGYALLVFNQPHLIPTFLDQKKTKSAHMMTHSLRTIHEFEQASQYYQF